MRILGTTGGKLRLAMALSALLMIAATGTAQAGNRAVIESGGWDDTGTDLNVCDRYTVDWHDRGTWQIEDADASTHGQFFPFSNHYLFTTVVRNPANGKIFTERYEGSFVERLPHWLGNGIVEYIWTDSAVYTVKDSKGRVAHREAGLIVNYVKFDTLNDSQQGGNVVPGYPKEIVNTWSQTFDFCALANRLIG